MNGELGQIPQLKRPGTREMFRVAPLTTEELLGEGEQALPTGFMPLDDVLGGGWPRSFVTELVGHPASGKTQLCCKAAVRAAAAGGSVVFIQTTGARVANRLQQLASQDFPEADQSLVLANVQCYHTCDLEELTATLSYVKDTIRDAGQLSLLVVDSFGELVSPELSGKFDSPEFEAAFGRAMHASGLLRSIAIQTGASILITNTTVSHGSAASLLEPTRQQPGGDPIALEVLPAQPLRKHPMAVDARIF
jgi:DNA repair protein RadB